MTTPDAALDLAVDPVLVIGAMPAHFVFRRLENAALAAGDRARTGMTAARQEQRQQRQSDKPDHDAHFPSLWIQRPPRSRHARQVLRSSVASPIARVSSAAMSGSARP